MPAAVHDLARARIERALAGRSRYRWVRPELRPQGTGWKVVSPNCSRRVAPDGAPIDIAWLEPAPAGWTLHRPDPDTGGWQPHAAGPLAVLLDALCRDRERLFWR